MEQKKTDSGRVLILRREGKIVTLLYQGNRLMRVCASTPGEDILDNIYIGKVKNVVESINAAFVEYRPGELCFLSLKEYSQKKRLVAGDEIVVQICREKQKTKEAGATTNLSFSGKYLVLTTGKRQIGYSSKLAETDKKRLQLYSRESVLFEETKKEYGIIFRTNAKEAADCSVLEKELLCLKEEADLLRKNAPHRTCYSILKKAPESYLKSLQDFYSSDYEKIITDDKEIYESATAYLQEYQPQDVGKLTFYEDELLSLSKLYSVEARLAEALDRKVWMKSGGYLIIDRAEALTCIDVNSGKSSGGKGQGELYLKINMEAAKEIAHQLLLRNISGIIIIDFINMETKEQNERLLSCLRELLAADPVRSSVVDMTPLGLVEVTRKKEQKSLWEQLRGTNGS